MGLFRSINIQYHLSQSAAHIEQILQAKTLPGVSRHEPSKLANRLVARVYTQIPHMLGKERNQTTDKLTIAALALAAGYEDYKLERETINQITIALAHVLSEIKLASSQRTFSEIEQKLINTAYTAFVRQSEQDRNSPITSSLGF